MAALFVASLVSSQTSAAQGSNWRVINTDDSGNLLYIDTGTIERLDSATFRMTMKFVNVKSDTEMYFLDELDCERNLIRRLSVSLQNPPCTGGRDYSSSFEGKWDKISTGLEEMLRDYLCGEVDVTRSNKMEGE